MGRVALIAAGLAAAVSLFVVLRPDADENDAADAIPATPAAPTVSSTTDRPRALRAPVAVAVAITVRDGRPVGGIRRVAVARGRRVRLVVRSTTRDHVHLHGYDLMRNVGPGAPAVLAFRASIAGVFELELEDAGLRIAELRVT